MRITIVSRDFPPVPSGMGDYADLLGRELARRGHTVTVLCDAPAESRDDIEVRPVLRGFNARGIATLDKAVAASKPDVILWQYNPFQIGRKGIGPSAGRIARALAKRAPLTLVCHELWYDFGRNGLKGFIWATVQRLETRAAFAHASKIVVTTDARRDMLRGIFPERRNDIVSIRIGANIEPDASRSANGTRVRLGLEPDSFVLAHFGSLGDGRDFSPAFDALRGLRSEGVDARLVCIGRAGIDTAPADLRAAVTFTGVLTRDEVSDALGVSDAYLFCEPDGPALGRKGSLLAAFAHGLPVLAYAGKDHDEELKDGLNVLLVEPNKTAIVGRLKELKDDPQLARTVAEGAKELYASRFSWPVVADAFEVLLGGSR